MINIILICIIVILIILGLGIFIKIINPLNKLINQLESESDDFNSFNIKQKGLIGRLISQIIKLNNKTLTTSTVDSSELNNEFNDLSSETAKALALISKINTLMEDTTNGALLQSENVTKSTSAMNDISIGIQETSKNIQTASELVSETTNSASTGQQAINKAMEQMKSIGSNISELYTTIKQLESFSTEINTILGIITGISGQTNLLALNAAIEAARAGESGRGFSVVAEEVRKLAEQSSTSAKQIGILIENIQNKTKEAVNSTNVSIEGIKTGINSVNLAGDAFKKVSDSIYNVDGRIQELASNAEQISSSTGQIIGLIDFTRKVQDGGVDKIQKTCEVVKTEIEIIDNIHKTVSAVN
ncbi:Methyl-accepting chemotaxis protein [Clostridium acidisoli DSM 12555]|jgi:methyl-accepting chemotaxis protein|uniref:Methyl-accepting chemotaxis protein n=1 Tax=Clostridium acidisoli DSM 12555 TaxID=1121291 RepID=A0A1W1XQD9_9CLOT|nr:methyl-accepting chemotaxis protein [Clostridium acidisoli]SMC26094.1 Methyl-accepting chemotaxis protein [Clostridium acidisoli DSM 12555]